MVLSPFYSGYNNFNVPPYGNIKGTNFMYLLYTSTEDEILAILASDSSMYLTDNHHRIISSDSGICQGKYINAIMFEIMLFKRKKVLSRLLYHGFLLTRPDILYYSYFYTFEYVIEKITKIYNGLYDEIILRARLYPQSLNPKHPISFEIIQALKTYYIIVHITNGCEFKLSGYNLQYIYPESDYNLVYSFYNNMKPEDVWDFVKIFGIDFLNKLFINYKFIPPKPIDFTILVNVCQRNYLQSFEFLLKIMKESILKYKYNTLSNLTIFNTVVMCNHTDLVKRLILLKMQTHIIINTNQTSLYIATKTSEEMFDLVLDDYLKTYQSVQKIKQLYFENLFFALLERSNSFQEVDSMVKKIKSLGHDINVSKNGNSILSMAVQSNDNKLTKALLKNGANLYDFNVRFGDMHCPSLMIFKTLIQYDFQLSTKMIQNFKFEKRKPNQNYIDCINHATQSFEVECLFLVIFHIDNILSINIPDAIIRIIIKHLDPIYFLRKRVYKFVFQYLI